MVRKERQQTFVQVPNNLAVQLEKAHKLRNRSGKNVSGVSPRSQTQRIRETLGNNRASVAAKSELERHLDFYYSALHAIASTNGEYTAQQRAKMTDLAREASQHGGADKVWEGLIDTGPDALCGPEPKQPIKGTGVVQRHVLTLVEFPCRGYRCWRRVVRVRVQVVNILENAPN